MIAKNVNIQDLEAALEEINASYYNGNIEFKNIEDISSSKTDKVRFTLKVKSSKAAGASRNPISSRRSAAACWHAHGHFFDVLIKLVPDAEIVSALQGKRIINKDGGNWQDAQLGSYFYPYYASEACDCNN